MNKEEQEEFAKWLKKVNVKNFERITSLKAIRKDRIIEKLFNQAQ